MFKTESGLGKVEFQEIDLAKMLNIDTRTLRKYEKHLQQRDKPIMTIIPTTKRDPITGLSINERVFDFEAYNNILAIKFEQIDDSIADTNRELSLALDKIELLEKRIRELERQNNSTEVSHIIL